MNETAKRRRRTSYPSLLVWRLALNLNQRDAARILGVTQSKYSRLERGVSVAVREQAKHIRARTGVPVEVLAGAA